MNILLINCSPVRNRATAEIIKTVHSFLEHSHQIHSICIDDYEIHYCKGCRSCHQTAKCIQKDDVQTIIAEFEWADSIVCVSPSYWADVPDQFKAFIDRCTPWCNTHEPHEKLSAGKKGYAIALRTGPNMWECHRIIESIEHFYGHMEISPSGNLGLCSIAYKDDVDGRKQEIEAFCDLIPSLT